MTSSQRTRARFLQYLQTGVGIDIGCGTDPIMSTCMHWDRPQGDAQLLEDVPDEQFDWVFSSHCLEHMRNPLEALLNWWRVLRMGGVMVVIVPDEDLYEQHVWPSVFNDDHKHTFTLHKHQSWSPVSINLIDLVRYLPDHEVLRYEVCADGYECSTEVWDRSAEGAETAIAIVLRKCAPLERLTNLQNTLICPSCGGEVIVYGQNDSGAWRARCVRCGEAGKWNPPQL